MSNVDPLRQLEGTSKASLTRREGEPDVEFDWVWTCGLPMSGNDSTGWSPPEPATVEVAEVRAADGRPVFELTDDEVNDLEAQVWGELAERAERGDER